MKEVLKKLDTNYIAYLFLTLLMSLLFTVGVFSYYEFLMLVIGLSILRCLYCFVEAINKLNKELEDINNKYK